MKSNQELSFYNQMLLYSVTRRLADQVKYFHDIPCNFIPFYLKPAFVAVSQPGAVPMSTTVQPQVAPGYVAAGGQTQQAELVCAQHHPFVVDRNMNSKLSF